MKMLTDKDIKKLSSVFATKRDLERFITKVEFDDFKFKLFDILDGIAKSIDDLKMEYIAIKTQLDRHERWIKEIAEKTGISLKE